MNGAEAHYAAVITSQHGATPGKKEPKDEDVVRRVRRRCACAIRAAATRWVSMFVFFLRSSRPSAFRLWNGVCCSTYAACCTARRGHADQLADAPSTARRAPCAAASAPKSGATHTSTPAATTHQRITSICRITTATQCKWHSYIWW